MRKMFFLLLVIGAIFSIGIAEASGPEWVQLTRGGGQGLPEMKLVPTRFANIQFIEVTVPGFYRETRRAGSADAMFVTTGLSSMHMEKGMPEIPTMKTMVALPEGASVDVRVVSEDWTDVKTKSPVAPSKGQILRTQNPASVPFEYSDFYRSKNTFPGMDKKVEVSAPFVCRDVRGVEITVNPFQYDNSARTVKVAKKMRIELRYSKSAPVSFGKAVPYEFYEIYKNYFMNFVPDQQVPRLELGNLLVITADQFADAVKPLVDWKVRQGFSVKVAKMSQVGKTAAEVYNFIKAEYDRNQVAYIILVGDSEFVPTLIGVKEGAASDPCYTKLAGNDHVPDAIISRISAKNENDVKNQVAKFVHYEQFPDRGADAAWYRKATGIASDQGDPTDYARAESLREGIQKYNYDAVDKIYDPGASKANLTAAINQGRGLINYIGHGSKTAWVTTYFGNSDATGLKNGRKFPVIWSVACVNGAFKDGSDCFCEAWLKTGSVDNPAGAVAMFGASTNAEWVPPCDMQSEINLVAMKEERQSSVGALGLSGILKAMTIYGTDPKASGVMLFEQYNMFGDCTLQMRTDVPREIEYKAKRSGKAVEVSVAAKGKPVKYARVALSLGQGAPIVPALTDDSGVARIEYPGVSEETKGISGSITITGQNLVPLVDATIAID